MIRDPFARINQRFAKFGIRPIRVAGPLDPTSQSAAIQATGDPSSGDFQSHLTPEERHSLLSSIARAPLSALGAVAGFLDKALGGRAIRSLLGGGDYRELLSILPGSDVLGITRKEDIVSGRDVLENLKILEKNQPGFDWGDVAGFGAEVLLDPAAWLTLGGSSVLTGAGKGLSKMGKLAAVERAAATRAGAKALKLTDEAGKLTTMSKRLFRKKTNLKQVAEAQESIVPRLRKKADGTMEEILEFKPETGKLPELRTYDPATGVPISFKEAAENTLGKGKSLDYSETLGSPFGVGLPFRWKPYQGERFLGIKTEKIAEGMDWLGDKARWSYPGRLGSKIWSPELRSVPMAEKSQKSALRKSSVNEAVSEELNSMFIRVENRWKKGVEEGDPGPFDMEGMVKKAKELAKITGTPVGKEASKELYREAQDIVLKRSRAVRRYIEGYELDPAGIPKIPSYDPENIPDILGKLKEKHETIKTKITNLVSGARASDPRWKGRPDNQVINGVEAIKPLSDEADGVRKAFNNLEEAKAGGHNVESLIDEGLKNAGMKRGVHHRVKPKLPEELKHLEEDIDWMIDQMDSSAKFAMDMGVNVPLLDDWLAKYMPREAFFIPEKGVVGAWRAARRRRLGDSTWADDIGSDYTKHRKEMLREVYGGTDTLVRLTTALGPDDVPLYVGKLGKLATDAERTAAVDDVAKLLIDNEFTPMINKSVPREYLEKFIDSDNKPTRHLRDLARWLAGIDPRHAEMGVPAFKINPMDALKDYTITIRQAGNAADISTDLLAENATPIIGAVVRGADDATEQSTRNGIKILESWHMNTDNARKNLFQKLRALAPENVRKELEEIWTEKGLYDDAGNLNLEKALQYITLPRQLEDDVTRYMQSFTRPETLHEFIAAWDAVSNIFRTALTVPWPAFHVRNLLSGQMNNFYGGASDPTAWGPAKWIKPVSQARGMLAGKTIKNIANDIPQFANKKNPATGLSWTDEEVTTLISEQLLGRGVVGAHQTREDLVKMFEDGTFASWASDITKGMPGADPLTLTRAGASVAGAAGRLAAGAVTSPLRALSAIRHPVTAVKSAVGAVSDAAGGIVKAGRAASEYVEGLNRIAPFLSFLKQGMSFEEAARRVKLLQVDYRALSEVEKKVFKRTILFYSFTRRQIPFILGNLAGEPGGAMAQMVKGIERVRKASNEGEMVPEWIAHTPAVRIDKAFPGSAANGMARYITNLGGLLGGAEDVLGVMRPGMGMLETAKRTGSGIMGRVNPMIQRPLELATGYSFFTGRPLKELKSPTGRLLGQIKGLEEPVESFAGIPLTPATETVIQSIPGAGRAVSTLRGLTDWPRRPIIGEGGEFSMANLASRFLPGTTGIRVSDIDLARQQNRLLQDLLEKQLESLPEARMFEHLYIKKEDLEKLSPEIRSIYAMYRKLASEAAKMSRERKKQAKIAAAFST